MPNPYNNYFELFKLPEKYALDVSQLEQQYFALQRQYHPDRFVMKPEMDRMEAAQQATTINQAYRTLKCPLARAEYLLSLQSITVNKDGQGEKPDQALLMQVMEQREALDEAETVEAILALENQTAQQVEQCIEALEQAFDNKDYDKAAKLATEFKYLDKFADEIRIKRLKGIAA